MILPYELERQIPSSLGLIVLQADETIEAEFRQLFAGQAIAIYHSRIPSAPEVTPETLARMEAAIPQSVSLFPPVEFSVIGYACTSGATIIGPENVAKAVRSVRPDTKVTDPLTAAIAWCRAQNARRIGFLTPYRAEVSTQMREALVDAGLEIASFGSFAEENEHKVARISERSILEAVVAVNTDNCDAIFVSCTNLRALHVVEQATFDLGKPVASSNTVLAWHMRKLANLEAGNEP